MSHDVYLKLLEVAPRVHSLLPLALIVAEGAGRRISAWRNPGLGRHRLRGRDDPLAVEKLTALLTARAQ